MDTTKPTTRNLFDSLRVYIIPNYQRAYVWNKDDQWEPLWLDILRLLEPDQGDNGTQVSAQARPHFLGAAVFKEITMPGHDIRRFVVVDGQQRITTLQILLTALADVLHSYGESLSSLESSVRSLTVNWQAGNLYEEQPDKVKPLAGDFLPFGDLMNASRFGIAIQPISARVFQCYQYFLAAIDSWLREATNLYEDPETRARSLFTVIADYLQLVAIFLDIGENESAIFEALNSRGEPLSEWEKIKNHILFKAGQLSLAEQTSLYEQCLSRFDEPIWREDVQSGPGRRRRSDVFLDYWLESQLYRPVDARRVFRECRALLENVEGPLALGTWCRRLQLDGEHFLRWQSVNDPAFEVEGGVEAVVHSRRRTLGIDAMWPLLLALQRAEMLLEDRLRCLRILDSYLWRRTVVGKQNRGYPEVTLECLKSLPQTPGGESHYSDALVQRLLMFSGNLAWPDDTEVANAVIQQSIPIPRVRVVLEALERAMMNGRRPGNRVVPRELPIEHIMPQTRDSENWPPLPDAEHDSEDIRDKKIHLLGNLTLVEHGLNSVLSNRPWHEKRRILHEQDNLFLNKELLNNAPPHEWYERDIDDRARRLAAYIVAIWPHGTSVTGQIERVQVP